MSSLKLEQLFGLTYHCLPINTGMALHVFDDIPFLEARKDKATGSKPFNYRLKNNRIDTRILLFIPIYTPQQGKMCAPLSMLNKLRLFSASTLNSCDTCEYLSLRQSE